jgi:predicted ester cyclase
MGIAPTGKRSTVTGINIGRYPNGKLVEAWGNNDNLGLLQQLGVVPMLAPAGTSA